MTSLHSRRLDLIRLSETLNLQFRTTKYWKLEKSAKKSGGELLIFVEKHLDCARITEYAYNLQHVLLFLKLSICARLDIQIFDAPRSLLFYDSPNTPAEISVEV